MDLSNCCQSCAMPMQSEADYGTNADGSKSSDYCRYCYESGAFTSDMTMEQMAEICVPHMVQAGMSEQGARQTMAQTLPLLKRWK